jgi:hypothetical protein
LRTGSAHRAVGLLLGHVGHQHIAREGAAFVIDVPVDVAQFDRDVARARLLRAKANLAALVERRERAVALERLGAAAADAGNVGVTLELACAVEAKVNAVDGPCQLLALVRDTSRADP